MFLDGRKKIHSPSYFKSYEIYRNLDFCGILEMCGLETLPEHILEKYVGLIFYFILS